jgi:hypothetical protein
MFDVVDRRDTVKDMREQDHGKIVEITDEKEVMRASA